MDELTAYLPQDRARALAFGVSLPTEAKGAALFADLSGFTPITEAFDRALGARHGAEALTRQLNQVFAALIAEVERYDGSVLGFAGDAITCWFAEPERAADQPQDAADARALARPPAPHRAVACALALQDATRAFAPVRLPDQSTSSLGLKVAVATGSARRLAVGDPAIQLLDVLVGAILDRVAAGEHLAASGEVLIDSPTAAALGQRAPVATWRVDARTGLRFAVLSPVPPTAIAPITTVPGVLQVPTSPPAHILQPWLLPAVYARHHAGLGAFLTELRPVAILFVRFTGIEYDVDPQAGAMLDRLICRVQAILARYDGSLLQLTIGDKGSFFYAAFGAPVSHEDDPRRAALAALALRALPEELSFLAPLQLGLSQGILRTGAYGGPSRRTYGALGDEVNLAARLMSRAAPGEVLVSGRMRAALADAFALEPLEPIVLKGMPEPLPIFRLAGARQRVLRLSEPAYALPMVGRQAELQVIGERLALTLAGQGQVLGIIAEAGMGKSRLVAEALRLARKHGVRTVGGSCQSYGTTTPYLVWEPIWRALFDLNPELPMRRQIRALEGLIAEWAPERSDAMPLLGPLLGLNLPENAFTRTLDPQHRKSALEALLVECITGVAREAHDEGGGGLLLALEDLHWIDALSHDLLERVAQAALQLPVLLVLAYRPPELLRLQAPRIEALPHFTRIVLGPLTEAEAAQAIRAKLAQLLPERKGAATPALIARITAKAQGNPFYVEELLNYLRDRGIDPQDSAAIAELDLPSSLHALILSRIDQLSAQQQATLKVASVIGRLFQFAWLHGAFPVLGAAEQVKTDLEELARLELTPLDTLEPELAYLFKHIVTQEVAYESLSAAMRAVLHTQLAAYLEARAGTDLAPYLDLLAFHYDRGDNLLQRQQYLRKAGEAAAARYANDAAIDYLSRALASAKALTERFELLALRELVYGILGERAAQLADLAALERLAEALDDDQRRATTVWRRIEYAFSVADYQTISAFAPAAEALAQRAGAPALAARFAGTLAQALAFSGDVRGAYAQAEEGLRLARAAGDRRIEGYVLQSYGNILWTEGDHTKARDILEQSIAVSRACGDPRQAAVTQAWCSAALSDLGDFGAARDYVEASLAFSQLTGDSESIGLAVAMRGQYLLNQGDFQGARTSGEQALAIFQANQHVIMEAALLNGLGRIAAGLHELVRARSYAEQALALAQSIGDQQTEAYALADLCRAAASLGDFLTARAAATQASERSAMRGSPSVAAYVQLALALLALWEADCPTAALRAAQLLETARSAPYPLLEPPGLIVLGHAELGQGRAEAATAAYQAALELQRSMELIHTPTEALAGLAQALLAQGDQAAAMRQVELILTYLDSGDSLAGAIEPLRVVRICHEVLAAVGDPRANVMLVEAHSWVQKLAKQLVAEDARHLLFEQAPHVQTILAAWEARHQ